MSPDAASSAVAAGAGVALELVQRFEQRRDSPRAVVVV